MILLSITKVATKITLYMSIVSFWNISKSSEVLNSLWNENYLLLQCLSSWPVEWFNEYSELNFLPLPLSLWSLSRYLKRPFSYFVHTPSPLIFIHIRHTDTQLGKASKKIIGKENDIVQKRGRCQKKIKFWIYY